MKYNLAYFMVVALCGTVHGDGQIRVQFTNFSSLAVHRFDNKLCDSQWGFHYFVVCVGITERVGHGCEYGSHITAAVSNRNLIDFRNTPSTMGHRAPLQFAFTGGIQPQVALRVTVYDDDQTYDDLVDNLFSNVRLNWNHAITVNLTARTSLLLSVWVECSATWYGPSCGVRCVAGSHYNCDSTSGLKLCHSGYNGDSCQHRIITTTMGCRANWYGPTCGVRCVAGSHYTCDSTTGLKLCHSGYNGDSCQHRITRAGCGANWYGPTCGVRCVAGSRYTCDTTTGLKLCHPGYNGDSCQHRITTTTMGCRANWYGPNCGVRCVAGSHYTCESTTGLKLCHPGYYGDLCQHRTTTTSPVSVLRRDNEDCDTLAKAGHRYQDDVYTLQAREGGPFRAYCDMSAEGWTVIQRRTDGDLDFGRSWAEYRAGFGEPGAVTEYWLGLDHMNQMTKYKRYRLRVTMQLGNREFRYAAYDRFSVGDVTSGYQLAVSGYSGTAGDALQYSGHNGNRLHNGQPFSTPDHDRDNSKTVNCAQSYGGGWWFNHCYWCNLNGPYVRATNGWPRCPDGACIAWRSIPGYEDYSLLQTKMEIMPYY